jgi:hypothetical protein
MKAQQMSDQISGAAASVAEPVYAMAAKAAPPVAVVSAHAYGLTLPELVQILTAIYVGLMIAHKLWHMWKELRTGKPMPESEGELP